MTTKKTKNRSAKTATKARVAKAPAPATGKKAAKADRVAKGASIEELRARYAEAVGRPSASNDRAYLLWKIAMAKRGKVRVGPPLARSSGPHTIVPFRIETALVEAIDAVWKREGVPSRNAFLRAAVKRELGARGERDLAERLGDGA